MEIAELTEYSIRLSGVVSESVVDGTGIRYTVFVQGCPHHCVGCHNPLTHPYSGGTVALLSDLAGEICKNPLLDGITLTGGEPFSYPAVLTQLARFVHGKGMNVWCYSGYTYEELKGLAVDSNAIHDLLNEIDVLVDGRFVEAQRNLMLKFRGSENQRVIDLKTMRKTGTEKIILLFL